MTRQQRDNLLTDLAHARSVEVRTFLGWRRVAGHTTTEGDLTEVAVVSLNGRGILHYDAYDLCGAHRVARKAVV